ncbi:MAG: DUF928 domain-containing protein [Leptolyngbya sp. RL_3_1]|nr:DUF928 domain-containing protein [Leptolyngbya sp. RL_3_1]
MNLRPYRNALMLSATLALGLWIGEVKAAISFNPAQTQFGETGSAIDLASRRRFRLGSRSSNYRLGGFSRNGGCFAEEMTPLAPPLATADEVAADALPIDVTTKTRPIFFVHMPEMVAEPISVQLTLQDEAGTQELASARFEAPDESGIIGLQPTTFSEEMIPGEIYLWQMSVNCKPTESTESTAVVEGWITLAEPSEPSEGSIFEQAVTLIEDGIWQDAVMLLAQARLNAPDAAAIAVADGDWQVVMEGVGLADFADEPILGIMQQ